MVLSLPEDVEDLEQRFGKSADDITIDEAKEMRLIDEDSWNKVVKRTINSPDRLLARLRIPDSESEAIATTTDCPKGRQSADVVSASAKRLKNGDGGNGDDPADEKDGVVKTDVSEAKLDADD